MASPRSTRTPAPTPTARRAATPERAVGTIQLGVIGIDSSHLSEFSRRINTLNQNGATPCQVTQMWTDGVHDMPADEVTKWRMQAEAFGVVASDKLDDMLDAVDGVLVLTVNGNRHLEHARPALERGLPTYIDKPLSCSLDEARTILELAERHRARCYSASSLRFAAEVVAAAEDNTIGKAIAIDAYGPGELNPSMPGLFHYGVHTVEMIDAIWGPGVARVRCTSTDDRDLLDLAYADGRVARLRMERVGAYDFGAVVHGTGGIHSFKVDFDGVYDRLVEGMVGFFGGEAPPASLERIVENIAVMEAGNRSAATGGGWIDLS